MGIIFRNSLIRVLLVLALTQINTGCGGENSSPPANSSQNSSKTWVRSHLADVYLWNNEIVDVPQGNYATAPEYFDALLVKSRDRFSFSMPQAQAASSLQEGLETGYGVFWGWAGNRLFALYVDPNSPASGSITRGTELTAVNGQSVATLGATNMTYLSSSLFPDSANSQADLTYRLPGTGTSRNVNLISSTYSITTVGQPQIINTGGKKVGYLLFNEHLVPAEQKLIDAVTYFKQQGINELVLDLRYNNGGYLFIAEEVASMVGGNAVQGQIFEQLRFNSSHPEKTADPDNTLKFLPFDSNNFSLPLLGLPRVFVITGNSTCSASESIINSLLPFIQVVRIGYPTCGKPYGFRQTNHDQQAYFAIQFEGVNANGTDNYKNGFMPTCQVVDDLNFQLGNISEARLSAALYYITYNSCPPATQVSLPKQLPSLTERIDGSGAMLNPKPGLKL